jgi:CMP-N-acetylneuraminic acid synthetase
MSNNTEARKGNKSLYTVIKTRESHTDYCRGCVMGSSSSEFEMVTTDELNTAISYATQYIASGLALRDEYLTNDWLSYGDTEVIVLVNGWGVHGDMAFDSDIYDQIPISWETERKLILEEAQRLAEEQVFSRKEEKRLAVHKKERENQEAAERRERARLAELKAKYEGGQR